MKFQSNALWPPGVCLTAQGDNTSTDSHDSLDSAVYVCLRLVDQGFGGNQVFFPVKTWVTLPAGEIAEVTELHKLNGESNEQILR